MLSEAVELLTKLRRSLDNTAISAACTIESA